MLKIPSKKNDTKSSFVEQQNYDQTGKNKPEELKLQGYYNPEDNQNWYELRILGKCPERRGYHSSVIHNKK